MWYFAYGSNMSKERMESRGINYTSRQYGLLTGYKLVFNKKAKDGNFSYANIAEEKESFVEGVLYEVTEDEIKILDIKEGFPKDYLKIVVEIVGPEAKKTKAITYIANPAKVIEDLLPLRKYLEYLLGGKDVISPEYYEWLRLTPTVD